ncbi:MAG: HAD family phosphatase [Patescibacteria group bacterium]
MIKTIIFDNNGVLSDSSWTGGVDGMIKYLGVKEEDFVPVWEEGAIKVDKGEVSTQDFLKLCIDRLGCPDKDIERLRDEYHKGYMPREDVRGFAKKLKKDFELVLLTNFGEDFKYFNKKWKMEEIFDKDKIFISADLRMVKPEEDIYFHTLEKIGRKPEEVVFIDDKQENIDTAERIGMHPILFKNLKQVEKDLESILQYDYVRNRS